MNNSIICAILKYRILVYTLYHKTIFDKNFVLFNWHLIYQVKDKVLNKTGIKLELELEIIGEKLWEI